MSTPNVKDLPKFGATVRRQRERLGMTATLVAQEAGMSLAFYSNLENGLHLPSLPNYKKLCRVLQVSPGKLLQRQ